MRLSKSNPVFQKTLILILTSIPLFLTPSCSNTVFDKELPAKLNTAIEKGNTRTGNQEFQEINSDKAAVIAQNFVSSMDVENGCVLQRFVEEIVPVTNEQGIVLLWIVNFGGNRGFVAVSNSLMTPPVALWSKTGKYDSVTKKNQLISNLINQASQLTERARFWPEDSLKSHSALWRSLDSNNPNSTVMFSNYNTHGNGYIEEEVLDWIAKGWEVYDASYWIANSVHMPFYLEGLSETFDHFNTAIPWANNQPANKLAYVVIRSESNVTSYPPKSMSSRWTTGDPYNELVPKNYPLSSQAIAVGQTLNYFCDSSIKPYLRTGELEITQPQEAAKFLYSVATEIGTVFGEQRSEASLEG